MQHGGIKRLVRDRVDDCTLCQRPEHRHPDGLHGHVHVIFSAVDLAVIWHWVSWKEITFRSVIRGHKVAHSDLLFAFLKARTVSSMGLSATQQSTRFLQQCTCTRVFSNHVVQGPRCWFVLLVAIKGSTLVPTGDSYCFFRACVLDSGFVSSSA